MQSQRNRRSYGTGSLLIRHGAWYGKWWVGGRQVMRVLGPVRQPGSRDGFTRKQAEHELRRRMHEVKVAPPSERLMLQEVGERYLRHLEYVLERKPSTIQDYRIMLRRHLIPYFGERRIERIEHDAVTAYLAAKAREGLARQTIINQVNFLHGVFKFAVKRGWATTNPVAAVDRPKSSGADPDIRFLTADEIEALISAVPDDQLGPTDRVLYLTAAMTGLRQGELVALRWLDVDWVAGRIRVRRNRVRGEYGTPKSKRSSRAVPMADRVAGELDRHYKRSRYQGDSDPVFAHPDTGNPYDASAMRKRFKKALKRAKLGQFEEVTKRDGSVELKPLTRFHDLRHTFGTRMAAAGVPLRTLQEWMGHRDIKTTQVYADYAPDDARERDLVERAFGLATKSATNLSETGDKTDQEKPLR